LAKNCRHLTHNYIKARAKSINIISEKKNQNVMKKVAIPIETKVRELDGKIWLSLNLIKEGHKVYIGPDFEIKNLIDKIKPDVYITKDPGDSVDYFDKLREAGVLVYGLDTEGAVYESDSKIAKNKEKVLNHIEALFAWANEPYKRVKEKYKNKDNIHVTGNPRFDLLSDELKGMYDDRPNVISEKYKNYVLVNTNFTLTNPYKKDQLEEHKRVYGSIDDEKIEHEAYIYKKFIKVTKALAHSLEVDVVVRPHPSEKKSKYESIFKEDKKIHVEDRGDVRVWIKNAISVIHNDCTTGIESVIMGIPAISFRPKKNEKYEARLPQLVSEEAKDIKEVVRKIKEYQNSEKKYEIEDEKKKLINRRFHNMEGKSARKISSIINRSDKIKDKNYEIFSKRITTTLVDLTKSVLGEKEKLFLRILEKTGFMRKKIESVKYRRKKFPGLSKEEIKKVSNAMIGRLNMKEFSIYSIGNSRHSYIIEKDR
jgi:surface carbohydrate biosynthesis protein